MNGNLKATIDVTDITGFVEQFKEMRAEVEQLRPELAAAQAEAARYKALWASVPWDALMELVAAARQNTDAMYKLSTWNAAISACEWVNANAPKSRPTT